MTAVSGPPVWNQPVTLRFTPHEGVSNVVEYQYTLNFEEHTVAASSDGSATVTFVATNPDGYSVGVRSRSQNGFVSSEEPFGSRVLSLARA